LIEQVRKGLDLLKAEGYVKPFVRTRHGKLEHVTGHRRSFTEAEDGQN
jgi:hypothetical protein